MTLTFLSGQLAYMRERGYAVDVVSSPGDDLELLAALHGATPHALRLTRRITPIQDVMAVLSLVRLLRRLRPTIVHAHTPKGGLVGMIAARLAGVSVRVYHLRGLAWRPGDVWRARLLRTTERISCRLAHRVFAVSRALRETAIREGLSEAGKVRVLEHGSGNGVDAEHRFDPYHQEGARTATRQRLQIPEPAVVVGFVGRLARDKGIVELADAWRETARRFPEAHLVLVGPDEEGDPVPPDILAGLEADPRVHRTGLDWDTPPLYAAMDLVILPSHREGFPNVPLEAAAMGLPVVATHIPGCQEAVVDGITGTLVPARDSRALSAALDRYLADPGLRRRHGHAGRERVLREFRPEAIWRALYEEYERLVAARQGKGT